MLPQYTPRPIWHPTISEVDDSAPPDATNWNPGTEALADNIAYLEQTHGHVTALNWGPEFNGLFSFPVLQSLAWDPITNRWILQAQEPADELALAVSYGLDEGAAAAWTVIGTHIGLAAVAGFSACCADPNTGGHYWSCDVLFTGGTGTVFNIHVFAGSCWGTPGAWSSTIASGQYFGCEMAVLGEYVIAGVTGTNAGDSFIVSSKDGFNTWTTLGSSAVPPIPIGSVGSWYLKSNEGFPGVTTPSCVALQGWGGGAANLFGVYSTVDGHTWTTSTSLASIAPAGGVVAGLAWTFDDEGPCWLVAIGTTTAHMLFFRSPDGIEWTAQDGGITSQVVVADMAAVGDGTLVCTLADQGAGGPSGTIFSVDGGITWYPCPATFTSNTSTGLNRSRIVGSPTGFMTTNGLWSRFSSLSGLPPNPL